LWGKKYFKDLRLLLARGNSKKGLKRIKAQTLRNARQILDLAIPDKIWPRSQKPKKNKGRHPIFLRQLPKHITFAVVTFEVSSLIFLLICVTT
jgi:hypothetical protein